MLRIRRATLAALLLAAAVAGDPVTRGAGTGQAGQSPGGSTPVIANGSFEEVAGTAPAGWRPASFQRGAQFSVDTVGHTGTRSARISAAEGADAAWTFVAVVRPYARYRLTGWIRTEGLQAGPGKGALLNVHGITPLQTPPLTGTQDWTRVELLIDSEGNDTLQINCLFGGWGKVRGTAWYDDIALELLSARDLNPAITVDASRRLTPLSPYIYGQFIEHLGRCIYGGIWAEMLEDRKFFYPVGDANSPWKPAGEPAAVGMSREAPFVGEHTPEVRATGDGKPAGLQQGDLAVVAGRKYVGRVVLAGDSSAGPVRVSLVWGEAPSARQTVTIDRLTPAFVTTPLAFAAAATTDHASLVIEASGKGVVRIGTASLMPADHVEGFRPDVLRLLEELDAPVYRWPGGNFVSGYNWRDGIGDRDRRPPRKNPAWKGVEHNDVGIHEFMTFCRLVGTEAYIAVNSGLGGAQEAADQVEYVNGSASSPMGRIRAQNGHPDPYRCRWWSIGNEMYGDWQLGHMPLADYVVKHNAFAEAMRAKDPSIKLIGVGAVGEWSEAMMTRASGHMDLVSEHFYSQERAGLLSHVSQIPRAIRRIAEAHRSYRKTIPALAGRDIRIALDEWNYWYGPHVYGELGTQYFLKDAIGIAAGIHEYTRQSDIIFMANYAQTVNVIGAIKTSKTEAVFDTTGLVLKLYRQRFGTVPVEITGPMEPLDVAAAWRENGRVLTLAVVNPTKGEQALQLDIRGFSTPVQARAWRIAGTDERACNVPGKPPQVRIEEIASPSFGRVLTVPGMSVTVYELR